MVEIGNWVNGIIDTFDKEYNDFLLECLKPYGITLTNIQGFAGRIYYQQLDCFMSGTIRRQFFLDSEYIFTVVLIMTEAPMGFKKIIEKDVQRW